MQLYHPSNSSAIVSAAQIIDVLDGVKSSYNPLGWRGLRLHRHNVLLPTPDGWLAQHKPKPGDYLVQDTEGRSKIVPEPLFLDGYHRASPADDSEHPAWSIRANEWGVVMREEPVTAAAPFPSTVIDRVKAVRREVYKKPAMMGALLVYVVTYERRPAEELEHDNAKLGGRVPETGDALVRDADGVERIIAPLVPLDKVHEVRGEFSPADLEALKAAMAKPSRMQLVVAQPQPVDVVPGLRVITDAPDKVPDGCSVVVITVEGDPWWKYAVTRQWFEDYKPQVGGGLVPVEGDVPLYYPPGSFKPALPTRVTKEALEAMFRSVTYEIRPDGRTTVCEITFKNGFSLRDESSAATIDNFKQDIGERLAYEKALDAAWGYAGFLLLEDRYRARLGRSAA